MISTDRNLFKDGSEVKQRIIEYGSLAEELHIIVFNSGAKFEKQNFGNVFLYPTNSFTKFNYILDAIKTGKKIIENWKLKIENSSDKFLVTSQDPFECGYVGYRISNTFKIPLHLQIHTDFLSPYFAGESVLNKIRVRLAKFLIPKADGIRVVSDRIRKSLVSSFPPEARLAKGGKFQVSRISVLPIFVDIEKIKNAPIKTDLRRKYNKFGYIILMAGRLAKEKNIEMVFGALAVITKEYSSTGLVIVGEGAKKKRLINQAKRLGLENNIVFEDWTEDLASYYKTADLFVLSSNYEGYGRTVVEAMAAGCPVIMTDVGLAGDVVRDRFNAFVIPVKDRQKLYEDLRLLLVSPERGKDLIFAGEQTLRDFPTKEQYLEQYKKSWEMCL